MIATKKQTALDFSNISSGINTTDPAISIGKHQVQKSLNAIIKQQGWERAPGFVGLKSTEMFTTEIYGLHVAEKLDGTEILLVVSGQKLYSVNTSTGATTEIYDFGGTGEAWFVDALDKTFVCNGSDTCKVESSTVAFKAGIDAPSGNSAAALAGGSLDAGTWNVEISYARKVSGIIVLYSKGESLGDVVLSGGNLSIRVTFANSSDAQVNNKVVWLREPSGAIWFFYHETDDNTTTAVDITSNSNKNPNILFTETASDNKVIGAADFLLFFDNRIFYSIDNKLLWTLKGTNVFNLEQNRAAGNGIFPFTIKGIFRVGDHLYLNTPGGMIRQPYGDVNSRYQIVDDRWWYRFPRTVQTWGGNLIGLTNDGIRTFDGQRFSDFDFSKDIKPEIDKLYLGVSSTFNPAGKVVFRKTRTEYHLSHRDLDVNATLNNRHFILNLDSIQIFQKDQYKVPWEEWEGGVSHFAISDNNTIFYAQSKSAKGHVFKENGSKSSDLEMYDKDGAFLTVATNKIVEVWSRMVLSDARSVVTWNQAQILAQLASDATLELILDDKTDAYTTKTVATSGGVSLFGTARFGEDTFSSEKPQLSTVPIRRTVTGKIVYIKFYQTADDLNFKILMTQIFGMLKKTRFT